MTGVVTAPLVTVAAKSLDQDLNDICEVALHCMATETGRPAGLRPRLEMFQEKRLLGIGKHRAFTKAPWLQRGYIGLVSSWSGAWAHLNLVHGLLWDCGAVESKVA